MKENYELTKGPEYWALLVMEEAAEVQQAVSKLLRFGEGRNHPEALDLELKDLFYCLQMMQHYGMVKLPTMQEAVAYAETKRGRNFTSVLNEAK